MWSMRNKEFDALIARMDKLREEVTASPEAARRALVGAGILNPNGSLSKNFYPDTEGAE